MGIFGQGGGNSPTRVANIRVTQSVQGNPIPAVMGCQRIQQSLLWMDGFTAKQESQGGKGGGKGGTFYLYTADVVAALCAGPVSGVGNVWSGQSWLNATGANETITIASVYAPQSAALLIADNGVGIVNTYSQSFTDYGAPAATVLSGSDLAPMTLVPYGTSLTTGEYSINPASIGTFVLTAVANASGGNTAYTGAFTGGTSPYGSGASNAYIGLAFVVAGCSHAANNGTFVCVASSATDVTLVNANGVAETHAATAAETGNTYHFASADVGKTAIVNYQFSQQQLMAEELDLVPSGKVITIGGTFSYCTDHGVYYYNPGGGNDGVRLTGIPSGTPTVTGTYKFSDLSTGGATVTFSAGDVNAEVRIVYSYADDANVGTDAPTTLNFELIGGNQSQAPWSTLTSSFPQAALGYTKTALAAYAPMSLGDSAEIQDNTFEVITPDAFGAGIVDCNPVTCIARVLTDTAWGLGSGLVPFPVACIDNGSLGTWGGPSGTPGARTTASTAWNWFAAQSFFISPIIDKQETAASTMGKWLEAGMCAAFMSEGLLKLVPYGDTSAAGNGCTWTAPQNYVVALDDTCFTAKEGVEPVKIAREAWQDAYNECQVQWNNRANQYAPEVTPDFDQAAINRYGLRIEDPQDWDFITTLPAAIFAANLRVKRGVNIRNSYTFSASFIYSYLEPMDIVPITTSSIWAAGLNNTNLGVVNLPVRIQKIVDDPISGLEITAEDYPWGTHQPVLFNKGISAGNTAINTFADPGNTEVVMFEATNRLTLYQGNEIWIGAAGAGDNWGGCNVWVSQDGTKYQQVGQIDAPARIGELGASFASGSDPDTVNSLVVNLVENSNALDAGTTTDADNGNTLCYVDGEIISYSTCTVTGQDQYTMNAYIRRGQRGSSIASHASASLFMRLDSAVFKYTYDPNWAGQTLYFKFQSVNSFQNNAQPLPSLTAVTFTVPGLNPGTVSASTGLILGAAAEMDNLADGPTYSRVLNTALTGNQVDLTKTGVLMRGSVPPILSVPFTYALTSTSITWSWPANSAVYRTDGTVTVIGAGSQAITGLSPSTLYNFYPIYDETLATLRFITTTDISTPSLVGYTGNGTSGYVETTTSLSNPTNFSIECWIQGNTAPTYADPLLCLSAPQTTGSGNCAVVISATTTGIDVYLDLATAGKTYAIAYTNSILDGQVHHIVFTWNNTTHAGTLYVDGASVATYSGSNAMATLSALYWHIGHMYGSNGLYGAEDIFANSWLSNAAVYNSVLSSTQVLNHYSAGANLGQTQLVAVVTGDSPVYYWKLQETGGTTATDSAGSNTGTYVGGVTLNGSEATHSGVGTPAIGWTRNTYLAQQAQILQKHAALSSGPMQVTTPASGSGTPGSGGGVGGGGHGLY